ncbi:UNVERIFIED_ORG: GSCFA domain-containing protein [Roseateles sp. XES5]|nr:GSCFA domain-containing protein [Roseateles sp. XES5]
MASPYDKLPSIAFWRKSVSSIPAFAFDPVSNPTFKILPEDVIATAGSCFAQHLSKALNREGYNYLIADEGQDKEVPDDSYGVFSARYGNVYTVRQLLQLFQRAFGSRNFDLPVWKNRNDQVVDPFRPQVQFGGFASQEDMLADRERHLSAVRGIFRDMNVLIFTLGLTEGWIHRQSGAVLPIAPGVSGGDWNPEEYEFVNFSVAQVSADLTDVLSSIRNINPSCRVILTVSPVPLIATYSGSHVAPATTLSKSVLRVAAEEVSAAMPGVDYFPSYEIITSAAAGGRYFEDDLRNIRAEGVAHVMRVFFHHYVRQNEDGPVPVASESSEILVDRAARMMKVVCDEEAIEEQLAHI